MEATFDPSLSKLLESYVGLRYLGNNNHKAENPDMVAERNKAVYSDKKMYGETDDVNAWKLNHYWFNCFGYSRLYPPFEAECVCGKELPKYNSYFYNPETSEVFCIGSGCADKLLGLFRARGIYDYKTKYCPLCLTKHKRVKSELCSKCSRSYSHSYWCKTCGDFVFNERIKKPCEVCLDGFDAVKHPCFKREVYEVKCGHKYSKCPDCKSNYYKGVGHTCGEALQCYRCREFFDQEHNCELTYFTCLKCNVRAEMRGRGLDVLILKCPDCVPGKYEIEHTCFTEHEGETRIHKKCVCARMCKVCFECNEHDCEVNQSYLVATCTKPKYMYSLLVTVYFTDYTYFKRWYGNGDTSYRRTWYFDRLKGMVEEGYITLKEVETKAWNLISAQKERDLKDNEGLLANKKGKVKVTEEVKEANSKRYFYCETCKHKIKNGYYYRVCKTCKGWIGLSHECDGVKRANKACKCGNTE